MALLGFMLTGAGHGSYLLLMIASSPLSLLWMFTLEAMDSQGLSVLGFLFILIVPSLMWGAVGWLLGSPSRSQHWIALAIVLVHYVSLLFTGVIEDPAYFKREFEYSPAFVSLGFVIYVLVRCSFGSHGSHEEPCRRQTPVVLE
ncbi:MAG TPA: hypothetical protein VFS77_18310 [Pyrinomonadaceae bacterium]|nr:hypothetical protein [Pyrinomonadaceae bacterium]